MGKSTESFGTARELFKSALMSVGTPKIKEDPAAFMHKFASAYGLEAVVGSGTASFFYRKEFGRTPVLIVTWTPEMEMTIIKWNDDFYTRRVSMKEPTAAAAEGSLPRDRKTGIDYGDHSPTDPAHVDAGGVTSGSQSDEVQSPATVAEKLMVGTADLATV